LCRSAHLCTSRGAHNALMRRLIPAAVLGLALSACGSTVQTSSTATAGGDGLGATAAPGNGLGGSGTSGSPLNQGSAATGGTTGGSSTGGASAGGPAAPGTVGGAGGGTTGTSTSLPGPAQAGLGVTAKTITIGYGYSPDAASVNAAIGASSFSQPDEQANMKGLIDEINAHGGIAGRKLVGVGHAYHVASSDSGSAQDQAACQDWTSDHKVIAVLSSSLSDTLVACLKQKGVLLVTAGQIVDSDQTFLRQYPNKLLLATMSQDRIFRDQAQAFQRQKWFGGWNVTTGAPGTSTKVGVITYDNASFTRSLHNVILPALKAAGHPAATADVFQVHKVEQESDTAATTAQIKNAVLKLQTDGVTHVVLGDASAFIMEFFGADAQSQRYYPRLGVTSGAAPYAAYQAGLVTAQQLNGMSGNGWLPSLDIPTNDAAKYTNSETRRCLDILKRRTGQTYTSTNAATIALGDCDSVFIFQKAMSLATALSPNGLLAGFDKIGSSYVSPTVGPTFVSARQHDTAVRAWDLNWVPSCTCVRYSDQRTVGPA